MKIKLSGEEVAAILNQYLIKQKTFSKKTKLHTEYIVERNPDLVRIEVSELNELTVDNQENN